MTPDEIIAAEVARMRAAVEAGARAQRLMAFVNLGLLALAGFQVYRQSRRPCGDALVILETTSAGDE